MRLRCPLESEPALWRSPSIERALIPVLGAGTIAS